MLDVASATSRLYKGVNFMSDKAISDKGNLPAHVAVIMDGNGRWAKARGIPRVMGHNAGMQSMKKIVTRASDMGLENLTVYAFSTENWKRSAEEVSGIFNLIIKYVESELAELIKKNVHINVIGKYRDLPKASVASLDKLVAKTAVNDGLSFNVAVNYGGRDEIVTAVNNLFKARLESGDDSLITDKDISDYTYTGRNNLDIPDPDLIIRTSGEFRISNFLVWQGAYSELMFTDTLWPDFTPEEFQEMVESYALRDRRFGGRNEESK